MRKLGSVGVIRIMGAAVLAVALLGTTPAHPEEDAPAGKPPPGAMPIDLAWEPPELPKARDVSLTTKDRLQVSATFWPAREAEQGPAVILLHDLDRHRFTWKPILRALRLHGLNVIAVDLRGHGSSCHQGKRDLSEDRAKRKRRLFQKMHADVAAAAKWLATEGACDAKRIGLMGAGLGSAVAIDAIRRSRELYACAVCLAPPAKLHGLNSVFQIGKVPEDFPLVIVTHSRDLQKGPAQLLAKRAVTHRLIATDPNPDRAREGWSLGTGLFKSIRSWRESLASLLAARLQVPHLGTVLDGALTKQGYFADDWAQATLVPTDTTLGKLWAYRVGHRLVFGGRTATGVKAVRLDVAFNTTEPRDPPGPVTGVPQIVCLDLESGTRAWKHGIAGWWGTAKTSSFGPTLPRFRRVVHDDLSVTFEGTWMIRPTAKLSSPTDGYLHIVAKFATELPKEPENSAVIEHKGTAASLTSRK